MISWAQFDYVNREDIKLKFENMCNILFNHLFFNGNAIFTKSHNNPGVEIEPILYDGEYVSFQAKHFTNKISYVDIYESCKKTVAHYNERLNVVYLFCNKDLESNAKYYKLSEELLRQHKIILKRICNDSILNFVETKNINSIKELFFGKLCLSKDWFSTKLELSLQELNPRYVRDFNVDIDLQDCFEFIYETPEALNLINDIVKNIVESMNELRKNSKLNIDEIYQTIINKLLNMKVTDISHINDIFNWFTLLKDELDMLEDLLDKTKTDEKDSRQKIDELKYIIDDINKLKFHNNQFISCIGKKVFLLEGQNGVGKSHLLGYEAEKHKEYRTVLILGQQLINSVNPMDQIISILNLDCHFDSFLNYLEGLGEIDNSNTIIIIDAINESVNHLVWKEYLYKLVAKVESLKHVKLICSIKTPFKENIFNGVILEKIKKNEIVTMVHCGFLNIKKSAINAFFKHYNIPLSSTSYLEYEFENPLFLKLFCETYESNSYARPNNVIEIFENYLKHECNKIKNQLNDISINNSFDKILEIIAAYFYNEDARVISVDKLYELCFNITNHDSYITMMFKNNILQTFSNANEEMYCHICYEKISEILISRFLIKKYKSKELMIEHISKEMLKTDEAQFLLKTNISGVFSILSIMIVEKYNYDIIEILLNTNIVDFQKEILIIEYIKSISFRREEAIDLLNIKDVFNSLPKTRNVINSIFLLMLKVSGRVDSVLNATILHEFLLILPLNLRDYLWTCFINDSYYNETLVFEYVSLFSEEVYVGSRQQKVLYAIIISWFFTASNRKLRDLSTRSLVKLLVDDYKLMNKLIEKFYNVNDPYVLQRIYASIYGAVLKSDYIESEMNLLCNTIFEQIFNKEYVYPDILLRDYALNVIEFANSKGCSLEFDINLCRPPYKSVDFVELDDTFMDEYYGSFEEKYGGLSKIKMSMAPQIPGYMYGDFGRYVFEIALNSFKNVPIEKMFYYSLYFIKNTLGYNDKYFSKIDKQYDEKNYYYGSMIERIGKKYQWIAFYHILALVSDKYEYDDKYTDEKGFKYKGSWRPYVRDIDPTLDLTSRSRLYSLPFYINQPMYNNWDEQYEWVEKYQDVINFDEYISVIDSNKSEWVMLRGFVKYKSTPRYDMDYKEVWKLMSSYLIKKEDYDLFVSKLLKVDFIGRWFPESHERYNLFSREYFWSPAYKEEFRNEIFEVEIKTGEKEMIEYPYVYFQDIDGSSFCTGGMIERDKTEIIGNVIPTWNEYLWEEQYDYSKDEVVSYHMPSEILTQYFGLHQSMNGIFVKNSEIVAVDFSLVKGNAEGLYIKKDYLDEFLKKSGFKIFWVCIGEKNDIKKEDSFSVGEGSLFRDISSLILYEDGVLKSKHSFGERGKLKPIKD